MVEWMLRRTSTTPGIMLSKSWVSMFDFVKESTAALTDAKQKFAPSRNASLTPCDAAPSTSSATKKPPMAVTPMMIGRRGKARASLGFANWLTVASSTIAAASMAQAVP